MGAGTLCQTPYGDFRLLRYPSRRDEPLLAWCAADLLLLEALHSREVDPGQVLVVNDDHGALCVALQARALWTDSALAVLALPRIWINGGRRGFLVGLDPALLSGALGARPVQCALAE